MKEQYDTVTKGFEVTIKSPTIKLILGGLLYMGNTLNAGNKTRGQADGCEVDAFSKSFTIKGSDGKSIMQVILANLHPTNPEIMELKQEL